MDIKLRALTAYVQGVNIWEILQKWCVLNVRLKGGDINSISNRNPLRNMEKKGEVLWLMRT